MVNLPVVASSPLFYELYDNEIDIVLKHGNVSFYKEGDVIMQEGSAAEDFFIIIEGEVDIYHKFDSGEQFPIVTLKKGTLFGEYVLIDKSKREATAISKGESTLLELNYNKILELYESKPKVFGIIMLNLLRMMANRQRLSNKIINALLEY